MFEYKFADIGDGITEGKILQWNYKVGDKVKEDDILVVVETDKVNAELPSPVSGVIHKINKEEGEIINVGEVIVVIDDGTSTTAKATPEAEIKDEEKEKETGASVIGEIAVSEELIEASTENATEETNLTHKALATPVARNLAKSLNIDINQVTGSGQDGRVLKEDILNASKKLQTPAPAPIISTSFDFKGDTKIEDLSSIRKTISRAMTTSKTVVADTVLFDEVIVDNLVELRNRNKDYAANNDIKLTFMAFVAKATIETLKAFPLFNASYDHVNEQVIYKNFINLGFAVDTPKGLIVPNIKDANNLSIFALAKQISNLASKAVTRTISLAEIQEGTFSITNFGSLGVSYGTPIINYPEVAILGIGKIHKKPVVVNDEVKISYVLPLSLAVDHRIIDGADAGRFINHLKTLLKDIELLLLS